MSSSTEEEDRELLARVGAGDRNAIGLLYKNHQKRVFLFVRRFISDQAMAEDITNDVFIEVWKKAATYEGRSRVSSWMLGIARFKALTEIRKRRPQQEPEPVFEKLEDDADDPEVITQKANKAGMLKQCLQALSNEHRMVLELIYYQERSLGEVAEILDIPQNTVKTRAFHARKQLSSIMLSQGVDRGWP